MAEQPGSDDGEPVVLVEVAERVATVWLNRPARRNALNRALVRRLWEVVGTLDADDGVDVIILTGTDPAFCAGVDLKEAASADGGLLSADMEMPERGLLPDLAKPVIGAVNGPTATGGLELAMSCDLLIASDRARFADTHSRVGVMPGGGMTVRLARWIGLPRAKQMSITGDYIDADTALRWGLVNEVVAHADLLGRARLIAASVVSNDPRGVRTVLSMYDQGAATTENEAWPIEHTAARAWAADSRASGEELDRRRAAVTDRGRRQLPTAAP